MPITMNANMAYKKYKSKGGTLPFTEFLHREKEKIYNANGEDESILLVNRTLDDSIHHAIDKTLEKAGLKTEEENKTVFGINKTVFIVGGLVLISAVIILVIKNKKR